ncbi:MAG: cyclic nucleotide-binding domain-containing protein [Acidobacteria bacterium]|nr:cyclic nucleotide-binding domain-containing protein [Acidobacteriota bacterium]
MSDSAASPSLALSLLSLCELFSEMEPASLGELASEVEVARLAGGETLMRAGDRSDCMYTVVYGRLHVFFRREDGVDRFAGEIGPGETIGEAGILDSAPRMATVRATRDCELIRISRTGFEKLVQENPAIMSKIARALARRLRSTGEAPPPKLRTIAVIAAGGSGSVSGFTAGLCKALGAFGPALHLSSSRFDQMFGRGAGFDPDGAVVNWLGELERAHRFVIWETDDGLSPWTALGLRLADRVIAVGPAGASPELNIVERAVLEGPKNQGAGTMELVLLHDQAQRVLAGTAKWLQPRNPLRHHHVRTAIPGDMGRLARILSGRAIGLTLGGGGARGFAHIGAIRAIEEAGIPIDMIGGVSMGAIMAGQYAMGCDWRTMIRINETGLVRGGLNTDLTLPLVSITSGRKLRRALRKFFEEAAVEDLWLNYFCVSCNLTTSELIVHRSGLLWECVNASNALPGILPPVLRDGHVLVDGGILNNQPGDILKDLCGGPVIVCNVSPRTELNVDASFAEMPSPWRVLWSQVNPFGSRIRVPSIPVTLMRTLLVASERKSREVERAADYYLRPPLDQYRLDDWPKIEEIVEVGYQYTKREIQAWQAAGGLHDGTELGLPPERRDACSGL